MNPEATFRAAEALAEELWTEAVRRRSRAERARAARVGRLVGSPGGLGLIMALTDEVLRIRQPDRAAAVLAELAAGAGKEDLAGLGPFDRAGFRLGARVGTVAPRAVIPLARERVRAEMGGVILPATPRKLARHIQKRRRHGIRLNINVLGEAILGEDEAEGRLKRLIAVLSMPDVDYVSVKISSICSQIDVLAFDDEVERIARRLRRLYRSAGTKFVNLDMEEHRDLELTLAVFRKVLDEPEFSQMSAGIVLQSYLPDSLPALEELCAWARSRRDSTGSSIKVRLVKGANLAMERVDSEIHGWPPAPFLTKDETDASNKRMLEVLLEPHNDGAIRIGLASHNVFEVAWAVTRATELDALHRLEIEMLEGMAPALAEAVEDRLGGLLLYAPVVDSGDLESAIAYLVRRLDENSGPDNFLARQWSLSTGSQAWREELEKLERSVIASREPGVPSARTQNRTTERGRSVRHGVFANEPDTDFTISANREWAAHHLSRSRPGRYGPVVAGLAVDLPATEPGIDPSAPDSPAYWWSSADGETVEKAVAAARSAGAEWSEVAAVERRRILLSAADELARRRGRLIGVMAVDAAKTVREGDPEVSEAIDFAAYYADHIPGEGFKPYGTVVVASPWNFPLSIPAGGVLAALAAGNAVILKPAPESVAVAGELVEALWAGGVPKPALQFVPCADGDASQRLVTHPDVDAVILTGAWDTARRFLHWKPSLNLHAETSGKNAIVITATADLDEAIADLVHSAFGHAGQKCSAASLAIVEASVYDDPRFLRRLADAVRSLRVGPAGALSTSMGPLIRPPEGPLLDAFSQLEDGERWLVTPAPADEHRYLWTPGVKIGVAPGSPFHVTECFGPVLGVMRASDLTEAVNLQNQPAYGLTAGLHALDPAEIQWWREHVHAGNLYVNRGITGAIVRRQPFGGWKRSVVGAGAKAGGPNYVASLGTWNSSGDGGSAKAAWDSMRVPVDPTGLRSEGNTFRYVPVGSVVVVGRQTPDAARVVGVEVEAIDPGDLMSRTAGPAPDKLRLLEEVDDPARLAAIDAGWWVDDIPVSNDPRRELLRWVREQAVSERLHRHGNVTSRRRRLS